MAARWWLAAVLVALLGAQGLAWVHAVLHPGAGVPHAVGLSVADDRAVLDVAAMRRTHDRHGAHAGHAGPPATQAWLHELAAGHDDGSDLCQWFDALCVAGMPSAALAPLLHEPPARWAVGVSLPAPATTLGWHRPPARAPPVRA
ncbi:hypothetical protein [Inhella crocodyli]|uniref:DUF2946 domain-containing protein n=1 Tax=Inhella crocodyli TaxID=2499851 RepID=A0A3S2UU79_9BURK|nr:hypothetical protein [Inhella crocodyli]RVT84776.1 hypothetical protein EOD73_11655 [Inhella crocodyli]